MPSLIRSVKRKNLEPRQTRYASEHEQCVLCDSKLEVRHEIQRRITDDLNVVQEIAECPKCRVRCRTIEHNLQ
jgi:hypothetical protein